MHRFIPLLLLVCFTAALFPSCKTKKPSASEQAEKAYKAKYEPKKYDLRAVWMPTVFRNEYAQMSSEQMQKHLAQKVRMFHLAGFNTIIFQVRPESDAFYKSNLEPWSRFLTGTQGKAPMPEWDPLEFLVKECHRYGMELHAWVNPYRAAVNANAPLDPLHPIVRHPNWFVRYGNLMVYNPGIPECQEFIVQVVSDIVRRYDIDAIHMDDYFYPYPQPGIPFPDMNTFLQNQRGFERIEDWRRNNVNRLVQALSHAIKAIKPYVRLGISPFGIYRNKQSHPAGSQTRGLQNYDDLYADVLLWDKKQWVDYVMPQLYWEMKHKTAPYQELAYWWQKNLTHAHYYIGQDVKRTMNANELHPKLVIANSVAQGNCMWPAEEITANYKGVKEALQRLYWRYPALVPPSLNPQGGYTYPMPVAHLRTEKTHEGIRLVWNTPLTDPSEGNLKYVIYYYPGFKTKRNLNDPKHILAITTNTYYTLPALDGDTKMTYFVTSLNRYNCESREAPFIKVRH